MVLKSPSTTLQQDKEANMIIRSTTTIFVYRMDVISEKTTS